MPVLFSDHVLKYIPQWVPLIVMCCRRVDGPVASDYMNKYWLHTHFIYSYPILAVFYSYSCANVWYYSIFSDQNISGIKLVNLLSQQTKISNWIHTVVGIDNRELWFDTTVAAIDRVIWWRYQAAGSIDKCDGRDVSISRVQVQQAEVSWARTAAMTVCVCLNEASFFFFFFFLLLLLCFPSLSCITSKLWHCKLTFVSLIN